MDIQWYNTFTNFELGLLIAFSIACVLYTVRILLITTFLKQSPWRIFIKLPIRLSYFVLLILALMGPVFGLGKKSIQVIGKDIFWAIDVSDSMNATDVSPTRLEKAKYKAKIILDSLKTDRMGIIFFGNEAYLQTPLTLDKNALNIFFQSINSQLISQHSSNIYAPLKMAFDRFRLENETRNDKFAKILVLITDGEHHGESLEKISNQLLEEDVRVFILVVGTEDGGQIRINGVPKKDKSNRIVLSKINLNLMNRLAQKTNGNVYQLSNTIDETPLLMRNIQEIKGRKLSSRMIDIESNKYVYFVWAALALIVVDLLFIIKIIKI